ncbi:MAG: hypothetical protein A2Y24_03700 [Clostridiales bacterium GWE2_32_10]|nr:MAG: hypothetical protein A2Y24_03700 [Clostridiales bacterium GWE2_32_10]
MEDEGLKCDEIEYEGNIVQYSKADNGKYKVVRVISTDPQVYLKKEFQPGETIKGDIRYKITDDGERVTKYIV